MKTSVASAIGAFAAPMVVRAQAKAIKIGMPTILSGRVAQLGTSSRNAVMLEVDKINAAGGLAAAALKWSSATRKAIRKRRRALRAS